LKPELAHNHMLHSGHLYFILVCLSGRYLVGCWVGFVFLLMWSELDLWHPSCLLD